jgi:acyl-CoA dehydrogenase
MLSNGEISSLLSKHPKFEDTLLSLQYAPRLPKGMVRETREVIAIARKFNEEVVRPMALACDRKTHEDPDYLPHEIVQKANEWGFYTMWIPKLFGGKGYNMPSMCYFVEEVSSACLGIMNVAGVHYLGVAGLMASYNTPIIRRVIQDVVQGEKTGKPCIIALAITEPTAGTDVEEVDLADKGKVTCHAEKVKGGYVFNGSKIFISMGHVSEWTVLYGSSNLKKPSESMVAVMVKQGMKGFSFGKHENKMGQRVCPASELVFEDCFVPDDLVLFDPESLQKYSNKPVRGLTQRYIDYIVSASRPAVGAFGTGAARGAFEHALEFASTNSLEGKLLINHEWVQCLLAEMHKNVCLARLAYVEANYANSHRGIYNLLQVKPLYYYQKYLPKAYFDKVVGPLLDKEYATAFLNRIYFDWHSLDDDHCASGWASLAKFAGTDMAVRNCQLAIELMGQAGLRHDAGVEKILRDAKLLQIYEGTNQLNRLNLFKCHIAPSVPKAQIFEE